MATWRGAVGAIHQSRVRGLAAQSRIAAFFTAAALFFNGRTRYVSIRTVDAASLNLSYQLVTGEGSAVAVDEVVNLRSTKTSLAGIRRWFECPGCTRRSRVLYAPRFRCRLCHGLSYESQFESRAQRANRRARKIRAAARRLRLPDGGIPAEAARHALGNLSAPRSLGGCCR